MVTERSVQAPKEGGSSPWGAIDGVTKRIPGVVKVSTSSHGGFWVSPERLERIDPRWPRSYSDGQWFEEDEQWAIVAVSFEQEWAAAWPTDLERAHNILRNAVPDHYEAITGKTIGPGESYRRDREAYVRAHPDGIWVERAMGDHEFGVPERCVAIECSIGSPRSFGPVAKTVHLLVDADEYKHVFGGHLGRCAEMLTRMGEAGAGVRIEGFERWVDDPAVFEPIEALLRQGSAMWGRMRDRDEHRRIMAAWRPALGGVLYAKDGAFDQALPLLLRDDEAVGIHRDMGLWLAARAGKAEVVKALLDAGANPDGLSDGLVVDAAAFHRHEAVSEVLEQFAQQRQAAVPGVG